MYLPAPLQDVVNALSRLPGIGPKTAARLAFYLLRAPEEQTRELAQALLALKREVVTCPQCFHIRSTQQAVCDICADEERDGRVLCVVEDALDVVAIERAGAYRGRYHVLQGVLSPIEGVGPDDLRIRELLERVEKGGIEEVILATNPSMEGDATAMYLQQRLQGRGVRVTRLARGLPVGGDVEYADPSTLMRALSGRQEMGINP
jgi:recombination protein RecR